MPGLSVIWAGDEKNVVRRGLGGPPLTVGARGFLWADFAAVRRGGLPVFQRYCVKKCRSIDISEGSQCVIACHK